MGCQWRIWIPLLQLRYKLRAGRSAVEHPGAENGLEALRSHFRAAGQPPDVLLAGGSWRDALWKTGHTGLPAVAKSKREKK